jgi:anti-sigma factor RsiW
MTNAMNCRHFQDQLPEYVDQSLPAARQADADQHLAECQACLQALDRERRLAAALSVRLRDDAAKISLRPETRDRIMAALSQPAAPSKVSRFAFPNWRGLVVPLGLAASAVLALALVLTHRRPNPDMAGAETKAIWPNQPAAATSATIYLTYSVPQYRFQQEGNRVLDTFADETVEMTGTLWTTQSAQEK